ncbi:MAG TPA: protein translocase subunit SecD [Ignavibacteria bacterium]|nr:protein translocase subunit SecD [Ignavibacteria bacterium]HMR41855.1 protein translocase subunit SecD [Ignavibacteria bacterium]
MKKNLSRIVITFVLIILSLYFLYPTYQDYQFNKELSKLSGQDSIDFLDKNNQSIASAREKRLKLGLDLKGGMYVVMDVDVVKLLEDMANKKDEQLTVILGEVKEATKNNEEQILEVFKIKLKDKGQSLKSYYGELRDSDADIEAKLSKEIDNSLDRAVEIVRNRVDQYGVAEPQIQKIGNSRIIVELPGVSNPVEVRKLLEGTALLEFKLIYDPASVVKVFEDINKVMVGDTATSDTDSLKSDTEKTPEDKSLTETVKDSVTKEAASNKDSLKDKVKETTIAESKDSLKDNDKNKDKAKDTTKKSDITDTSVSGATDTNLADSDTLTDEAAPDSTQLTEEEFKEKYPFFTMVSLNQESGTADGYVKDSDKEKIIRLLNRPDVKAILPSDIQFAWSNRTFESGGEKIHILYAVKKDPELTGKVITDARSNIDPTSNTPMVSMEMNSEGSSDWARITGANINKRIAIVLDNVVYSAPVVRNKITGGNSQIEGMADVQEAKLLEIVLKAGALPAPVKIIEERSIGPSLGEDSIKKGIFSSVAALLLVALFMIVYYRFGGTIADVALMINFLLILGIMASLKATLTLPGIAGLILSIGMSVDTNVLIFERIREEMSTGKPIRTAVDLGYKRAFSAIIDSHLTSLITGVILYQFGSGPIQGFALTLIFGLIANLFTAIVITHYIFDIMIEKGKKVSFG